MMLKSHRRKEVTDSCIGMDEMYEIVHQAMSSIVNEVMEVILDFFIFFYEKSLQAQKARRCIQANKNKKGSIFMRIKSI